MGGARRAVLEVQPDDRLRAVRLRVCAVGCRRKLTAPRPQIRPQVPSLLVRSALQPRPRRHLHGSSRASSHSRSASLTLLLYHSELARGRYGRPRRRARGEANGRALSHRRGHRRPRRGALPFPLIHFSSGVLIVFFPSFAGLHRLLHPRRHPLPPLGHQAQEPPHQELSRASKARRGPRRPRRLHGFLGHRSGEGRGAR